MRLLAAFAFGSVCAYAVAVWAITDWLEIDWRFKPEEERYGFTERYDFTERPWTDDLPGLRR